MLRHPTIEKLNILKLTAMSRALQEQQSFPDIGQLCFEERLGLLADRELTERGNRRLALRLRFAKLRQAAAIEDMDLRTTRGIDKTLVVNLAACQWVHEHLNVLICGPTGVGKTFLACALAHKACREGYSAFYARLPRLLQDLELGRGDGRYAKLMKSLAKIEVLVLDDLGIAPLTERARRDLLELMDDRYNTRSTVVTSQLPVAQWHDAIGDPTLADAILDRLVHNAYKISLQGNSMRKTKEKLTAANRAE